MQEYVNMNRVRKYVWVALCAAFIVYHISLLVATGNANGIRNAITFSSIAYILMFVTAIFHELKLNKTLLLVMVLLSLLTCAYTVLFTKFF